MDEIVLINKKNKNIKTLVMLENQKLEQLLVEIDKNNQEKNELVIKIQDINDSQENLNNFSLSVDDNQYFSPELMIGQSYKWLKLSEKYTSLWEEKKKIEEVLVSLYERFNQSKRKTSKLEDMTEVNNIDYKEKIQKKADIQILEQLVQKGQYCD